MSEIDLMDRYPQTDRKRLLKSRKQATEQERKIAMRFGREYFDGPRRLGLGGYSYDPKFFGPVVEDMIEHYGLTKDSSVLDVGCAKGFMLYDFQKALPGLRVRGIDVSDYCLIHAVPNVRKFLDWGNCEHLPYEDKSFDLVVSIATIHNLSIEGVRQALKEIVRVSRKYAFIKVNGYRTDAEKIALEQWNLVAKTILSVDEWKALFSEVGYAGDYAFFTP